MLKWFFGARRRSVGAQQWNLDTPLLRWSGKDIWTAGMAMEGTLVLGSTGSGKSSGSGRAIIEAMLSAGFGGIVLSAKSERAAWIEYCRATSRLNDLVIFGADEPWRFNFLDYERGRPGVGAGQTENLVLLLSAAIEIAERNGNRDGGREEGSFWARTSRQLMRNLIDLAQLAHDRVTIPELYALLVSAPGSREQVRSDDWRQRSLLMQALKAADAREKTPRQQRDFELVTDFFLVEWPSLADKTRSIIVATFTSTIDILNRGLLHELLCTETNITPDATTDGKIILLDLPVKEFGEVGQIGQVIFKHAFQRAIERRDLTRNARPVFLVADECQYFITSHDQAFQTTCRSSRVATLLLTQNVSNVYVAMGGGDTGRAAADSLFACLNTKILHANGDSVTNQWAADLIGRSRQWFFNTNRSQADDDWLGAIPGLQQNAQHSSGLSESMEYELQPAEFTRLRTGSPRNGWLVDGIVFQNGRRFAASGSTWLPVTFAQKH